MKAVALMIALAMPALALAKPAPVKKKTVLFVCTGNFYRSRFAQAMFNEQEPKTWTAISRGLDASTPRKTNVSPLVSAELARRHVSESRVEGTPTQLTQADLDHADLVVLMDGAEHTPMLKAKFPSVPAEKLRSWSVKDVPKTPAPQAFDEIAADVTKLIDELQKQ